MDSSHGVQTFILFCVTLLYIASYGFLHPKISKTCIIHNESAKSKTFVFGMLCSAPIDCPNQTISVTTVIQKFFFWCAHPSSCTSVITDCLEEAKEANIKEVIRWVCVLALEPQLAHYRMLIRNKRYLEVFKNWWFCHLNIHRFLHYDVTMVFISHYITRLTMVFFCHMDTLNNNYSHTTLGNVGAPTMRREQFTCRQFAVDMTQLYRRVSPKRSSVRAGIWSGYCHVMASHFEIS